MHHGLLFCWVQGSALQSLQTFFQTLVQTKAKSASFEALLAALLAAGHDSQIGKTAQHNIAQCIAGLCTVAGANETSTTVNSLLSAVQGNDVVASRLALYSLGEIGRGTDLSKFKQLQVCLLHSKFLCIHNNLQCLPIKLLWPSLHKIHLHHMHFVVPSVTLCLLHNYVLHPRWVLGVKLDDVFNFPSSNLLPASAENPDVLA